VAEVAVIGYPHDIRAEGIYGPHMAYQDLLQIVVRRLPFLQRQYT
jgi:hypothetical protein